MKKILALVLALALVAGSLISLPQQGGSYCGVTGIDPICQFDCRQQADIACQPWAAYGGGYFWLCYVYESDQCCMDCPSDDEPPP